MILQSDVGGYFYCVFIACEAFAVLSAMVGRFSTAALMLLVGFVNLVVAVSV